MESSKGIRESIAVVRYDHSEAITSELCQGIDVRIIWGGDETVNVIRRIMIPPYATEACFPNRVSLAIIDFSFWKSATLEVQRKVARDFAMDAFQFGQSACSSPRALVWIGTEIVDSEKENFWELVLQAIDRESFGFSEIDFVDKLVFCDVTATRLGVKVNITGDNRIVRLDVLPNDLRTGIESESYCGNGLFFESEIASLNDIRCVLSRKMQTLSYAGFQSEQLSQIIESCVPEGIDRVVPFGRSLEFSHVWDGMDFLDIFLRKTTLL